MDRRDRSKHRAGVFELTRWLAAPAAFLLCVVLVAAARTGVEAAAASLVPTATLEPSATPRPPTETPTATATETPTITPTATPGPYGTTWEIDCEDDDRLNGYLFNRWCVPGLIEWSVSRGPNPPSFIGVVTYYAEGVMERVAKRRGLSLSGKKGAVALPFCGDIGSNVWLQRPGHDWEGPFVVADCSGRNGLMYHILQMGLAAEVDHETAARWGGGAWAWVKVCKSSPPCGPAYDLGKWLEERIVWATEDAPEVWTP